MMKRARSKHRNHKKLGLLVIILFLSFVVFYAWPQKARTTQNTAQKTSKPPAQIAHPSIIPAFKKDKYSIDEAGSIWAVVNKGRVLPINYTPKSLVVPAVTLRTSASSSEMHLRPEAGKAIEKLFAAAASQGINLKLTSGYRSYSYQTIVYGQYVKSDGMAKADTYSARPGHSEHQTGLAADVEPFSGTCELETCFENTPEGKWLAANAYKYGFIIRYEKYKESLTGYQYEPWHIRYVGAGLAAQIERNDQTLEQLFGLKTFTHYPARSFLLKM